MASLWLTGDTQFARRRNREAILGRLQVPLFDVNQAGTHTVNPKSIRHVGLLPTSAAVVYTAPATAGSVVVLHSITITNVSATPRQAVLFLVAPAGSANNPSTIFGDDLAAGETVTLRGPWFLAPSASIRAQAAATLAIAFNAQALEFDSQPSGQTLKVVEGVLMDTTGVIPYFAPAPSASFVHAVVLAITICNLDSSSRLVTIYDCPDGGSIQDDHVIFKADVAAKETVILDTPLILLPLVIGGGAHIVGKASVTDVVSMRLTVIEV